MIIKTKKLRWIVFLMFLLYVTNNAFFEKTLFFNEILSLIGLYVFLTYCLKKDLRMIVPKISIFRLLMFFWLLCGIYLIISLFFKTNWYFYLRNLSIFYSTFTFFIGFYWKNDFLAFMHKIRNLLSIVVLSLIPAFPAHYEGRILDRYSIGTFFPFFFKKNNFITYLLLLILNFAYAYFFQSFTGVVMSILLFIILILPRYAYFKILFSISLVAFIFLFMHLSPYLAKYKEGEKGKDLFGNLSYVYSHSKILQADPNSSWRMVYWYRIVVENFPGNLAGIGFGTPYIPYTEGKNSAESLYDDKHDAHTTGTHNTFITIFARLGIGVLVFFVLLYSAVLREFYSFKEYYLSNNNIVFFMSFFAISIIGLFNPTLETPTYSGMYWFFLGLVASAVYQRHSENNTNSPLD